MLKVYYRESRNSLLLGGKTIAMIGYGSRRYAYTLNLKEPRCNVIVGLYEGSRSWKEVQEQKFEIYTAVEISKKMDVIMILTNDKKQVTMCKEPIMPNLRPGMILMFAHGFAIHFEQVVPPKDVDVTMIAPKAPGHAVRSEYQRGRGTPCLVAVYQDATGKAMDMALVYGQGIGGARAGILETIFRIETETDLLGEQAVLCDGVRALMKVGFEALAEAGYALGSAYFECMYEMKLIVDLIYESGLANMRYSVSNIAEYDDCITGPKIITDETKKAVKKILSDIQDGSLTEEQLPKDQIGCLHFSTMRKNKTEQPLEKVEAELRKLYNWNGTDKLINN